MIAALALAVACASFVQSYNNAKLLIKPKYEVTAEFAVTNGRIFNVEECFREPKARARIHVAFINTGYSAFSINKLELSQKEEGHAYFVPHKSDTLLLTTGRQTELPYRLEPGESLSVLLPATFFTTKETCTRARDEEGFLYRAKSFIQLERDNARDVNLDQLNQNDLPTLTRPLRVVYRVSNSRKEQAMDVSVDGYVPEQW